MKKLIFILLVVALCFLGIGCGQEKKQPLTTPQLITSEQEIPETILPPVTLPDIPPEIPYVPTLPHEIELCEIEQKYSYDVNTRFDKNDSLLGLHEPEANEHLLIETYNDRLVEGTVLHANICVGNDIKLTDYEDDFPLMEDSDCYFDVYFRQFNVPNVPRQDYIKVTLQPYRTFRNHTFLCTFYDSLYPHMVIDASYECTIVIRKGTEILGYGTDTFVWTQENDGTVNWAITNIPDLIK